MHLTKKHVKYELNQTGIHCWVTVAVILFDSVDRDVIATLDYARLSKHVELQAIGIHIILFPDKSFVGC